MVLFGKLLESEVLKLDPIVINNQVTREPKFGSGNSDDLRKFVVVHGEEHFPFCWLLIKDSGDDETQGLYRTEVELNLCTRETETELLNTVRLDNLHSYQKVLVPFWNELRRNIEVSGTIEIIDGTLKWREYPNYKFNDKEFDTQEIWDVLKVKFTAQFNNEYTPCCQ